MAQKRMFSLLVTDTDKFLDMPVSAQALYFHLGMHGDDDGFVCSPRKIARAAGCNDDDLRLLASKGYIMKILFSQKQERNANMIKTLTLHEAGQHWPRGGVYHERVGGMI